MKKETSIEIGRGVAFFCAGLVFVTISAFIYQTVAIFTNNLLNHGESLTQ